MSEATTSATAEIRAVARRDIARAEGMLTAFLARLFAIPVQGLKINVDQYSLNSLNGFFASEGAEFFFKFHQEEGEEVMRGEYYRAEILAQAGLPVDQPLYLSTLPGEQVLVYRRRADPRFSDVLLDLDFSDDTAAMDRAIAAEAALNDQSLAVARASLAPITPQQSTEEPIHRLFHQRLIDPANGAYPGGRLARFYVGKTFDFPGNVTLTWDQIRDATPVINGVEYRRTFGQLFDLGHARLAPERLADAGGIVAHGDAHNANVWYERGAGQDRLSFFDPAFAGAAVPSLLAEVKPTFHNIFAHPLWLYSAPQASARYHAQVALVGGRLVIETDWALSPVRRRLLAAKAAHFWRPWLATLAERGFLPHDWEDVVRLGLFLSPTLVANLSAAGEGSRQTPVSSAIGLGVALMVGAAPVSGRDVVTDFFDAVRP